MILYKVTARIPSNPPHSCFRAPFMKNFFLILTIAAFIAGCATPEVTDAGIQAASERLDFGDSTSATLVSKAWKASSDKDYPELFAYTQRCVELYGEKGKKMNSALTYFEPSATAGQLWALNDVGTCLYIMANAYVELEMYQDAAATYRTLATDFKFSQCWDPQGWFWKPAETAEFNARKYRNW